MQVIKQDQVQEKIITLRGHQIIVDADMAELYGLDTREINQAVKNNPEKFHDGYLFELKASEKKEPIKSFDRFKNLKYSSATIKGFTEKDFICWRLF